MHFSGGKTHQTYPYILESSFIHPPKKNGCHVMTEKTLVDMHNFIAMDLFLLVFGTIESW